MSTKQNRSAIIGGGVVALVGILIVLVSIHDPREDAFPSGRAPAFAAGLVFFLAGIAVATPALFRGRDLLFVQTIIGALLFTAMAAVPLTIGMQQSSWLPYIWFAVLAVISLAAWWSVLHRIPARTGFRIALATILVLSTVALFGYFRYLKTTETPAQELKPVPFTVDRERVFGGESVTAQLQNPLTMPEGYTYWITIVAAGSPVHSYGKWQYLSPGTSRVTLTAPKSPGSYEVRIHADLNRVLSSHPIIVQDTAGEWKVVESPETGDKK